MKIVEDVRKTVGNPKPLYFAAGVGEAAVEALKDAPSRLGEVSAKATEVANEVAGKVAGAAESVQSKIALGQLDAKTLRGKLTEPDLRAAREKAQNLLLVQVGRALEVAGKAVEAYDELSERGKVVVDRVLAGRVGADVQVVTLDEAVVATPSGLVVVEEVAVFDEKVDTAAGADRPQTPAAQSGTAQTAAAPAGAAKSETPQAEAAKPEAAEAQTAKTGTQSKADAKKPTAQRRAATPRKKPQA